MIRRILHALIPDAALDIRPPRRCLHQPQAEPWTREPDRAKVAAQTARQTPQDGPSAVYPHRQTAA